MSSKILNVAIIGQGRSGRDIHGRFLQTEEARTMFRVAAVAEPDELRRQRAASEYGCDVYADFHELLKRHDLDLIVNATPSDLHPGVTLECLGHGFNTFCEKPAARTVRQLDAMIDMARRHGVYFNVFQQSRFAPYYTKIREILDSGVLGRVLEADICYSGFGRRWDWQTLQCFCAGSLYNTGPHPVDQALDILRLPLNQLPNVWCRMDCVNTFGDAEDYVKLLLTAKDRPLVDLSITSCDCYPTFTYKILGQNGSLRATMALVEWKYFDPRCVPSRQVVPTPLSDEKGFPAYCSEQLPWQEYRAEINPNGAFDEAVAAYYRMTYEHLVNGRPTEVTPQQVRQQIAVIEEAHRQNPLPQRFFFDR